MKLTELLQIQKDLNAKIGSRPKSREDICMAIVEECGELSRALRPQWRWWNWKQKEDSIIREEPLKESVDILHFLLTAIEFSNLPKQKLGTFDELWDSAVIWGPEEMSASRLLSRLLSAIDEGRLSNCLVAYVSLVVKLGFTREQVEAAFLEKAQVNRDRMSSVNQH